MPSRIQTKRTTTSSGQPIILMQSPASRAINLGYIQDKTQQFIPARLHYGALREADTYAATVESFQLPEINVILKKYQPRQISTITVLRETLACRLGQALLDVGIQQHFGDAFIGASHIKGEGAIKTAYLYENVEGLVDAGLWVIADSICVGRNLLATLESLLSKFTPKEIILLAPIISKIGTDAIGTLIARKNIPVTFVGWGGLFGVDEKTLYDMPWGHKDTQPVDVRDQKVFVDMYGPKLCMGGDFGNNYYSPSIAKRLYEEQLKEHGITPKVPSAEEVLKIFTAEEILMH